MVSEEKKKLVKEIAGFVKEYPIIGVVNMSNLPAPQLQNMRSSLRESMKMIMTRKTLLARGLEAAGKENVKDLIQYFKGMPALIFTKENPFTLYKILEKNKSSAPAKAGQEAPKDVIVKAGPTSFAPGPVIGELGALGVKSGVEGGKIVIKEDSVVVKEGDVISAKAAEMLKRLGIEPMEIGLDLVAVWEKGTIFKGSDLHIDEAEFETKLMNAAQWAVNLSIEAGIVTKDTVELMIVKAFRDSKAVALEGNILADAVLEEVLGKVEREALALKAEAKVETVEKPVAEPAKEEKKEEPEKVPEPPKEEPKPEPKPEPTPEPEVKEEPKEEKKEEPKVEEVPEPPKEEVKEEIKPPEAQGGKPPVSREETPEEVKEEVPAVPHKEITEDAPEELKEPEKVPEDIEIKKPDIKKEHVEEIEEIKEEKHVHEEKEGFVEKVKEKIHDIEDKVMPCKEHADEEKIEIDKEAAEEQAKKDFEKIEKKTEEEEVSAEELKVKAESLKEEIKEMKEEQQTPPSVKLMVEKTKEFAEKGKGPSASDLLSEVDEKEEEKEEVSEDEPSAPREEVPSAQELYDQLKKKGTLRTDKNDHVPSAYELAKRNKK